MSPEQLKQALIDLLTRWSKESDGYSEAAERAEDNDCASHEKVAEVYGDVHDELKVIVDKANLGLTPEQLRRIRDMMTQIDVAEPESRANKNALLAVLKMHDRSE